MTLNKLLNSQSFLEIAEASNIPGEDLHTILLKATMEIPETSKY